MLRKEGRQHLIIIFIFNAPKKDVTKIQSFKILTKGVVTLREEVMVKPTGKGKKTIKESEVTSNLHLSVQHFCRF